jgi:hypothetical protein
MLHFQAFLPSSISGLLRGRSPEQPQADNEISKIIYMCQDQNIVVQT